MRIGIASLEFPPLYGGGVGTYSHTLSHALARAGHEVHVFTNTWEPEKALPASRPGTPEIHLVPAFDRDLRPLPPHDRQDSPLFHVWKNGETILYWSFVLAETLRAFHEKTPLDVLEFPESPPEGYVPLALRACGAAFSNLAMTITLHTPIREVARYNRLPGGDRWFLTRAHMEDEAMMAADALASPSRSLAEKIAARLDLESGPGYPDVIPNPLDLSEIPSRPGKDEASPFLLFVGRLEFRKGVDIFVRAALQALEKRPDLRVVLAGRDCPAGDLPETMRQYLDRVIPADLASRFRFPGLLPREEILALYARASACVFPAPWDNFPYACAEAMAAGGRVVATNQGGCAEMIQDGKSGLLIPPGDPEALARGILRVLEDPVLAKGLSRNAPLRIREFLDPARIAARRLDHYEKAMGVCGKRLQENAGPGKRGVALIVSPGPGGESPGETLASARKSAREAGASLDISLAGFEAAREEADHRETGETHQAFFACLERAAKSGAETLLFLKAGETISENFLRLAFSILENRPDAAWATAWALSPDAQKPAPHCGTGFSPLLEMLHHRPIPFALIRARAFWEAGGLNPELPPGFRDWDLWLALCRAGWKGVTIPSWEARAHPGEDLWLLAPPSRHDLEKCLAAVWERNRGLFARHAGDLWIFRLTTLSLFTDTEGILHQLAGERFWHREFKRHFLNTRLLALQLRERLARAGSLKSFLQTRSRKGLRAALGSLFPLPGRNDE